MSHAIDSAFLHYTHSYMYISFVYIYINIPAKSKHNSSMLIHEPAYFMGRVSHHLVVGLPGYPPPKTAAPLWGSPTRNSFREGAHQPLVLGAFVKMIPIFFRFMCTICINRIIYTDNIYKSLLHTYIYIYTFQLFSIEYTILLGIGCILYIRTYT